MHQQHRNGIGNVPPISALAPHRSRKCSVPMADFFIWEGDAMSLVVVEVHLSWGTTAPAAAFRHTLAHVLGLMLHCRIS